MAYPDSDYPGGIDSFPDPDATLDGTPLHSELHLSHNDAIEHIEGELGVNPAGTVADVAARLDRTPYRIATATPTGTTFTFSSIPQTFHHLLVVGRSGHNDASSAGVIRGLNVQFNGLGGENYDYARKQIVGSGTSIVDNSADNTSFMGLGLVSLGPNRFGGFQMFVPAYAGGGLKTAEASGSARVSNTVAGITTVLHAAGLWQDSDAITSITFTIGGGSADAFLANTRFSLYGLP